MRRLMSLAGLLALTTPGVLLVGPMTLAQAAPGQSAKPGLLQTAWFWETAYEQSNPPVAAGPAPATEPSGVPKGDVGVAHTSSDDTSSKEAVLAFQVGALKPGTTVNSFTVAITLDTGSGATNVNAAAAPVVACLPTRLWQAAQGGDYTDEPPTDCSDKVTPKVKGDTYTFAIPTIAQDWVDDQNVGVALVNDPANTQTPFQTVFSVKSVKATMSYTTAPPLATPVSTGTSTGTGTAAGAGSAGSGSTGAGTTSGAGAGSSGSVAPPPGPVSLAPSGPTVSTTPGSDTGQPPVVAGTNTPTAAASLLKPASSAPGTAFWLGGIAIALLVVVAGAILADGAVPVPNATTTRLGRVLRDRERVRARARETELVTTDLATGQV